MDLRAQALTTAVVRRIPTVDNSIAVTPNARGRGTHTDTSLKVRGVNRQLSRANVGLNSFGPNPTANPVGAEEGGSSGARTTTLLGTAGVRHGARFPRRPRGEGPPLHHPPRGRGRRPSRRAPRALRAPKLLSNRDRRDPQKPRASPPLQGAPSARVRLRGA